VGQAQDQLREQASTQHRNLVTNLRTLGDQLTSMADRSDQSGTATDLVGEAGSRAHAVASWLDKREPGELLDELRSFARRRPGVFVLGALAGGVVAGRLTRGAVAAHQEDGGAASRSASSSAGYGDSEADPHFTGAGPALSTSPTEAFARNAPLSAGYPTAAASGEPPTTPYRSEPSPGMQP
jgi:hypothetical protein